MEEVGSLWRASFKRSWQQPARYPVSGFPEILSLAIHCHLTEVENRVIFYELDKGCLVSHLLTLGIVQAGGDTTMMNLLRWISTFFHGRNTSEGTSQEPPLGDLCYPSTHTHTHTMRLLKKAFLHFKAKWVTNSPDGSANVLGGH